MINTTNKTSFRDPSGFVLERDNRVLRGIVSEHRAFYEELLTADWYKELVTNNKIQDSVWLHNHELDKNLSWLEHHKLDFPLFPHEICAEQLYESALLTLEIAHIALEHNIQLKDASAWNVVFNNGKSVFIDVTSFEPYIGNSLWIAYGQFCRHYLIPLLLYKTLKLPPSTLFISNRDGVSPETAYSLLGFKTLSSLVAIETVFLPCKLASYTSINKKPPLNSNSNHKNKELLKTTLKRLENYVISLQPSKNSFVSTWSEYESARLHYSEADLATKENFIQESLKLCKGPVLDLGCNQGQYSSLANEYGLNVVGCDIDENTLNRLQANPNRNNLSLSKMNICLPTPAIGWDNLEYKSFIQKSENYFNLVLCLGLIHHMLVTERIPLKQIMETLARLSNQYVLIEWIEPSDEKFQEIANLNQDLYSHLDSLFFESVISNKFVIHNKVSLLKAKRSLYFLEKK